MLQNTTLTAAQYNAQSTGVNARRQFKLLYIAVRKFYAVGDFVISPVEPNEASNNTETKFRGWRLLGIIILVVLVIAGISAVIDYLVIGPLDGRIG